MTIVPGAGWRWARRFTQCLALVAIVLAPLLGGWQRLDRSEMAVWEGGGFDLPARVRERLPAGEPARDAYDALQLVGGGSAVEYVGVPIADPVASAAALARGAWSWRFLLALGLPLLLAIVLGRVFCGWFCPFGTIARIGDAIRRRLPGRPRPLQLPDARPLRWLVLAATLALSIAGLHVAVFLMLPHVAVQQSVYGMWLLGGGGAAFGIVIGHVLAGLVFGPTIYCAAVCPTGAALSLVGRRKLARVAITEPTACGQHCTLCDNACWLELHPASGDAGPDCDSCARCFRACPHANLHVAVGARRRPARRHLPVVAALLTTLVPAGRAHAEPVKPQLVLDGERTVGDVTMAVSVVDLTGVKLDADWGHELSGVELSVYIARAAVAADRLAAHEIAPEVYRGPLRVTVDRGDEQVLTFNTPTAPISTPDRAIYRRRLPHRLHPGDTVTIEAIDGWLTSAVRWQIPARGTAPSWKTTAAFAAGATLVLMGLLSLALGAGATPGTGPGAPQPSGSSPKSSPTCSSMASKGSARTTSARSAAITTR